MKRLFLASALTALTFSATQAADAVIYEPAPTPELAPSSYDWSGVYVGAQAGYGWGSAQVDYVDPRVFGSSHDPDGFLGGVYAGYNHHLSNDLVLGFDADIAWTGANSNFKRLLPSPSSFGAVDIGYTAAIRARVGFAVDRFLPYIAGGLAISHARFTYDMPVEDATISSNLTGWALAAGLDYAVSDNLILRTEYRYSDFGSGRENAFPTYPNDQGRYDLRSHDMRFGIAYKF